MAQLKSENPKHTANCVHGTPPPCVCACPANLHVRDFMKKLARGSFNGAYRALANDVLFPEIALRLCGGVCGQHCASNLDILEMERVCIAGATNKTPPKYSVSQKESRVAIVGAGISGMACALRLSMRGFQIWIFDKNDEPGGRLSEIMDASIYRSDFELQFTHAPYNFCGGKTVTEEELKDFDAVYVATGQGGDDFGLMEGLDPNSFSTRRTGWFMGGEITGVSAFSALAQGRVAATTIEKYLLFSGSMSGVEESFLVNKCLYDVKNSGEYPPPHPQGFSPTEVKAEAARCQQCDCTICFDQCPFMQKWDQFPPRLEESVHAAVNPDTGLQPQINSRMVFTCMACGHCGSVCPQGISMDQIFLRAKRTLKEDFGKFPQQLHSFYHADMENANVTNRLLYTENGTPVKYLLFPGCQASASGPEQMIAAYDYIHSHEPSSGIWLACCSIPALWSGDKAIFEQLREQLRTEWNDAGRPTLVMVCPTCQKTFRDHLPEIPFVSIYELIMEWGLPQNSIRTSDTAAVFDPCASRDFPEQQSAVRSLCQSMGYTLKELDISGKHALCCGNSGHIYPSDKKLTGKVTKNAAELLPEPYITYCFNCRNVFLTSDKPCRHLLDDVFGIAPADRAPHISEFWPRRAKLKNHFSAEGGAAMDKSEKYPFQLLISDELFKKMDRLLIGEEELKKTIFECERNDRLFVNENGNFVGSLQIGFVTYWVEYKHLESDKYQLLNAYSHKLTIVGLAQHVVGCPEELL